MPGKIFVRAVHGQATYSREGTSHDLKANTTLDAGVTITTGPDSYVYVDVNGTTSSVRIAAETILALKTVDRVGPRREGKTETMLVLQVGSVLGRVPKLPANSKYEITTPCGVAGVRGTDWSVVVTQLGASQYGLLSSPCRAHWWLRRPPRAARKPERSRVARLGPSVAMLSQSKEKCCGGNWTRSTR